MKNNRLLLLSLFILFVADGTRAQETLNTVVNTLKERVTLSGYAQAGYTYDDAANTDNTFDVKRIIFMADGKITENWSCYFMYNFGPNSSLLEVYTDYHLLPGLTARMGQFKTPYTIENQLSPTTVELINCYSLSANYLAAINGTDKLSHPSGGRDQGFMIYGDLFEKYLSYRLAVMNGQGINVKDKNNQKDIVGYLLVQPLKGLSVGGSFIKGKGHAVSNSAITGIGMGENYTRNRWSMGAMLTTKPMDIRAEYLSGKDGSIKSDGFYVVTSAHIAPKLDVIASYDYFNANRDVKEKQTNYVAGVQYWFYPRCRVQAQYTRCEPKNGENSNVVQAQVQVRF